MNQNEHARRCIIVTPFYPPSSFIAAERAARLALSLAECQYQVTVLCPRLSNGYSDPKQFAIAFNIEIFYFNSPLPGYLAQRSPIGFAQAVLVAAARALTFSLGDYGWLYLWPLFRLLSKEIETKRRPDFVLISGPPYLYFFSVLLAKLRYHIPVVLDYRDAWSLSPARRLFSLAPIPFILESFFNKSADVIVAASKGCASALRKPKSTPVLTLYNIPSSSYESMLASMADAIHLHEKDDMLTVAYAGSLYRHISLDVICKALERVPISFRKRIRIHYCGVSGVQANKTFEKYGCSENLVNYGLVSKEKAVSIMYSSDICLAITSSAYAKHKTSRSGAGEIPTKVFDYIILSKRIVHICPPLYEARVLLERINYQHIETFCPWDLEAIAHYLASIVSSLDAWRNNHIAAGSGHESYFHQIRLDQADAFKRHLSHELD